MNRNNFLLHTQDGIVEFIVNDKKLDLIVNGLKESFSYNNVFFAHMTLRIKNSSMGYLFDLNEMDRYGDFYKLVNSKINTIR